jgi:hypothetical protein
MGGLYAPGGRRRLRHRCVERGSGFTRKGLAGASGDADGEGESRKRETKEGHMSRTEIERGWETALGAAERAVALAVKVGAMTPVTAAETRGKLARERKALRAAVG